MVNPNPQFPPPYVGWKPSGGISKNAVLNLIKKAINKAINNLVLGAPARAIFPVQDTVTDPGDPQLMYKVVAGDDLASIVILGSNLTGIVSVDASTDVKVGGNAGTAPVVGTIVVADTNIVVPLDATNSTAGDFWGILLTDGDGNVYAAPSPVGPVVGA